MHAFGIHLGHWQAARRGAKGEDQFIIRLARAIRERERFVRAMNRGHVHPIFQRNVLFCKPVSAAQIKAFFLCIICPKIGF